MVLNVEKLYFLSETLPPVQEIMQKNNAIGTGKMNNFSF
jgi:hypothetical protein